MPWARCLRACWKANAGPPTTWPIRSDVTLRELAESIAKHAGTKVVFQLPSETEREGYSTADDEARAMGFGAGMGLPNMKRNADDFEIESEPGKGTRICMRFSLV